MYEGKNKITVQNEEDSIYIKGGAIYVEKGSEQANFDVYSVRRVLLVSYNPSSRQDNLELAIEADDENVIILMSEHRCFEQFVFEQLSMYLILDFYTLIDAMVCEEDRAFEIFRCDKVGFYEPH